MTILAQDTFQRANQSGFGTSSDSETWTEALGSGTVSLSGDEGIIVSTNADTVMQLGSRTSASVDTRVRFAINNANDIAGIVGRFSTSGGGNDYKLLYYSGQIHLNKMVNGTNTQLVSGGSAISASTFYWFRLQITGSSINGKIWQDGQAEPASWTISTTDTSISGAGGYALLANTASGSSGVQFDHFVVTDGNAALATSPATLSFNATAGGTNPASQSSTLSETSDVPTAWTSSIAYGSGSAWLAISPTSGNLTALGTQSISVGCTTGALAIGTYNATITLTASTGNATATIVVTFTVAAAPLAPATNQTLYARDGKITLYARDGKATFSARGN